MTGEAAACVAVEDTTRVVSAAAAFAITEDFVAGDVFATAECGVAAFVFIMAPATGAFAVSRRALTFAGSAVKVAGAAAVAERRLAGESIEPPPASATEVPTMSAMTAPNPARRRPPATRRPRRGRRVAAGATTLAISLGRVTPTIAATPPEPRTEVVRLSRR